MNTGLEAEPPVYQNSWASFLILALPFTPATATNNQVHIGLDQLQKGVIWQYLSLQYEPLNFALGLLWHQNLWCLWKESWQSHMNNPEVLRNYYFGSLWRECCKWTEIRTPLLVVITDPAATQLALTCDEVQVKERSFGLCGSCALE